MQISDNSHSLQLFSPGCGHQACSHCDAPPPLVASGLPQQPPTLPKHVASAQLTQQPPPLPKQLTQQPPSLPKQLIHQPPTLPKQITNQPRPLPRQGRSGESRRPPPLPPKPPWLRSSVSSVPRPQSFSEAISEAREASEARESPESVIYSRSVRLASGAPARSEVIVQDCQRWIPRPDLKSQNEYISCPMQLCLHFRLI